jgi:hypothetical protein
LPFLFPYTVYVIEPIKLGVDMLVPPKVKVAALKMNSGKLRIGDEIIVSFACLYLVTAHL